MRHANGSESVAQLRLDMQQAMQRHAAVFRSSESLSTGVQNMDKIASRMGQLGVADKSLIWNTDLIEALELENLMGQALVTIRSADQRHAVDPQTGWSPALAPSDFQVPTPL